MSRMVIASIARHRTILLLLNTFLLKKLVLQNRLKSLRLLFVQIIVKVVLFFITYDLLNNKQ